MKKIERTEIILKNKEYNLTTYDIPYLLPYGVGDIFYYSERDCPAYYEHSKEEAIEHFGIDSKIDDFYAKIKMNVKENHIKWFKVVSVNNSTELALRPKGKKILSITKSLIVVEHKENHLIK